MALQGIDAWRTSAAARRAAHGLAAFGCARVLHVPGADADDSAGDRNHVGGVWTANRLPMSQSPLPMLSTSFTGFGAGLPSGQPPAGADHGVSSAGVLTVRRYPR